MAQAAVGERVSRVGLDSLLEENPALSEIPGTSWHPGRESPSEPEVSAFHVSLISFGAARMAANQTASLFRVQLESQLFRNLACDVPRHFHHIGEPAFITLAPEVAVIDC